MKALILATALIATTAHAEPIAELKNKSGGYITINSEPCERGGHVAYSTMPGQSTLFGCWFRDDHAIHILWSDNDARSYPYGSWTLIEKKKVEPTL